MVVAAVVKGIRGLIYVLGPPAEGIRVERRLAMWSGVKSRVVFEDRQAGGRPTTTGPARGPAGRLASRRRLITVAKRTLDASRWRRKLEASPGLGEVRHRVSCLFSTFARTSADCDRGPFGGKSGIYRDGGAICIDALLEQGRCRVPPPTSRIKGPCGLSGFAFRK